MASFFSQAIQITPSWLGYDKLKYLVIFGDSYSDVGYHYSPEEPKPTPEQPLGVAYPGVTWAERNEPNWVGHLVTNYTHSPLLAFCYAVGGDTIAGVQKQIVKKFLPVVGKKPQWAEWKSEDTLFITWIGINDAAYNFDPSKSVEKLFEMQELVYEAGARNFLFINVPPINRSPAVPESSRDRAQPYATWNTKLQSCAEEFSTKHPDVTTMIYSSWMTFTRVLDDPVKHGFKAGDGRKAYGGIWVDHLHPTSRMHDWIAADVYEFLSRHESYEEGQIKKAGP
ncbi:carbohydrate esterase family 16 protein [Jaapia argillacea MUCL 33604]|uniref:Carbohydrate esterase family 16 protein n=1 Tax=Jaapia argillacea MUCL 33604 TaxID=933084 RepID=A0A067Q218_9AGAM|nr:carbohydrate esterase family 16 protein [Jaapia argillacea MUCL 33604]